MTLRKNSRDLTRFESTGDEVASGSFKSWRDVTKILRSVVSRLFGWQDPRLLREGAQIGKEPRKRMGMRLSRHVATELERICNHTDVLTFSLAVNHFFRSF
jgi:hypothetical protein